MAQVGIREFDGKKMFFEMIGENYQGFFIEKIEDFDRIPDNKKYVIKPDMLFGKRGKLGLVGVELSVGEMKKWYQEKNQKPIEIKGKSWYITACIVEPFTPHQEEYYVSFEAQRNADVLHFSVAGGVDIEENWDQVEHIEIPVEDDFWPNFYPKAIKNNEKIQKIISKLWQYYKNYGFTYLEINPFCFDSTTGEVVLLDMVAKVDDQEFFLQNDHWKDLSFPQGFWYQESAREEYIKELDQKTGASLKLKFLNPKWKIWTLLSGGGGSLVISDTLWFLGYHEELANYGELSGDPDRYYTREYTRVLFEQMLEANTAKYLIIAGAIANFTQIDKTFAGIIDVLEEKADEIRQQNIKILVRRGGLNDTIGLQLFSDACKKLSLPCVVADSNVYMTDILKEISL